MKYQIEEKKAVYLLIEYEINKRKIDGYSIRFRMNFV